MSAAFPPALGLMTTLPLPTAFPKVKILSPSAVVVLASSVKELAICAQSMVLFAISLLVIVLLSISEVETPPVLIITFPAVTAKLLVSNVATPFCEEVASDAVMVKVSPLLEVDIP
jgi:hypothetical protein